MQVANHSKFVQTLGRTPIEPGAAAEVSDRWGGHTVFRALVERGVFSVSGGRPPLTESHLPADPEFHEDPPEATPVSPADLGALGDGDIPDDWHEWHVNKRKAWVRKCDDAVLLAKISAVESSDKVRGTIDARLSTLEGGG